MDRAYGLALADAIGIGTHGLVAGRAQLRVQAGAVDYRVANSASTAEPLLSVRRTSVSITQAVPDQYMCRRQESAPLNTSAASTNTLN